MLETENREEIVPFQSKPSRDMNQNTILLTDILSSIKQNWYRIVFLKIRTTFF